MRGETYVTMPGKIGHFVIILDFEILVPTLKRATSNGEVGVVLAYTVLE